MKKAILEDSQLPKEKLKSQKGPKGPKGPQRPTNPKDTELP